jgi:hypothetical protein
MGVHVDWDREGGAQIVSVTGDSVLLRSSVPSPPGSLLQGTLRPGGERLRFKVRGAKRREEGDFLLDARAVDATRAIRERLEALARDTS